VTTPEDRLRRAITSRTSRVEPDSDALTRIEEKLMTAEHTDTRKRALIGVGAAAAIIAVVVAVFLLTGDDDPVSTDGTTTTTTTEPTTTTTAEQTTTSAPEFAVVDPAIPVFPDPATSQRFDDPIAVATAFATGPVGFIDPVVGEFQQGDSRSGEVEVRPAPETAPTVMLVRQLEDDHWFVIGAETDSIRLETPAARDTISSPQALEGLAYAFEGTVEVRLLADGEAEPIGETFVTGRGDGVLGDFSGQITFASPPAGTFGTLILISPSGQDGRTWAAEVLRVGF
jgi:Immunoglobulin-like domain of bacterial spore germination